MGISSLGVGSSILTQDVLDQLRKADEASVIRPIDLNLANENDKKDALDVIDAAMKNLSDSIDELKNATLFDARSVDVSGTSVEVTADANSDVQEFSLNVLNLATKEIDESGSFSAKTDTVASAAGSLNLNVNGKDFTIDYDDTTTLDDLKRSINDVAGQDVDATIVQIADGDFRLFLSSANTGANQDITITDTSGNLSGTQLTSDKTTIQDGVDAQFEFNSQLVTRHSNSIDDLITGYNITLKETGSSNVNVAQNRDEIMSRIDSFVTKYNAAIDELDKMTKSSTDSKERGIFSTSSTIKGMKSTIENMIGAVGGSVGTMYDFGFDVDKDGKLSVDKSVIENKLDDNASNVEAFFSGGDYENADGTITTLTGAFAEMATSLGEYTDYNGNLDQFQTSINEQISSLEESKTKATERLDSKYEILKKKYAAYDAMIAKLNNASNVFIQMANAQTAAQKQ
jgi:flagellar hook-associated protein 2